MKQPLRQTLVCGGTNRIDTEAYAYQPGKDGIPIYQTWDEYQDYDQGISGRKMQLLEIGWNISATSKAKSLKFEVTMTLVGATTLYSDVAKFQGAGQRAQRNAHRQSDWHRAIPPTASRLATPGLGCTIRAFQPPNEVKTAS